MKTHTPKTNSVLSCLEHLITEHGASNVDIYEMTSRLKDAEQLLSLAQSNYDDAMKSLGDDIASEWSEKEVWSWLRGHAVIMRQVRARNTTTNPN